MKHSVQILSKEAVIVISCQWGKRHRVSSSREEIRKNNTFTNRIQLQHSVQAFHHYQENEQTI